MVCLCSPTDLARHNFNNIFKPIDWDSQYLPVPSKTLASYFTAAEEVSGCSVLPAAHLHPPPYSLINHLQTYPLPVSHPKPNSIGLNSGDYLGRYTISAPLARIIP